MFCKQVTEGFSLRSGSCKPHDGSSFSSKPCDLLVIVFSGATVGVLLPSSLTPEMHSLFESLMEELTAMKIQTIIIPRDPEAYGIEPRSALGSVRMRRDARFSEKVSSSIVAGMFSSFATYRKGN